MHISFDVNGLPEIDDWLTSAVEDLVREITFGTEREAKLLLQTSKATGRIYRRGKVVHQASAAGEPPATDTGLLVNSIQAELESPATIGKVEIGAAYAAALEFGTGRMEPRPFVIPAIDAAIDSL